MRRPSLVRRSGPYRVISLSDGKLQLTPAWPQFPKWTPEDGGGPGLLSRLGLADDLERWLNAPYGDQKATDGRGAAGGGGAALDVPDSWIVNAVGEGSINE